MAIGNKIHDSFVSGDCLVNITEVSRALKSAQEGSAEIVQTSRLVSMAIGSEIHSSSMSRDCFVNINEVSRVIESAQE